MSITVTFSTADDFAKFASVVATNPTLAAKLDTVISMVSADPTLVTKLDTLISMVSAVQQEESVMAADLSQLQNDVSQNTNVIDSAITLLGGLKSQLDAAIAALPDPTQLQELSAALESKDQEMADAIVANTPAASG